MSIQLQLSRTASLVAAVDAVRNWRAGILLLLSLGLAGLMFGLAGILSVRVHVAVGLLFGLLGLGIAFYGSNGVGIMMMDEAGGRKSRPMLAAVLTSLATGHRLILVMLMVFLAYLVGLLAMVILLLLCKLPGLGPLLFSFVFPLCAVISGVAIFALYAVVMPLAAPAVWAGATAMQGMSRLAAIARERIVTVIISMLVLFLIVGLVAGILTGVMLTGTLVTGGLASAIVQSGPVGLGDLGSIMNGGAGAGGYIAAGALGGGLVWALTITLPALVYLRGCCQVYLANVEGVNVQQLEQQVRDSFESARRKAGEIREKGEAMAARHEAAAQPADQVAAACPACGTPCASDDAFCGSCGHKLA